MIAYVKVKREYFNKCLSAVSMREEYLNHLIQTYKDSKKYYEQERKKYSFWRKIWYVLLPDRDYYFQKGCYIQLLIDEVEIERSHLVDAHKFFVTYADVYIPTDFYNKLDNTYFNKKGEWINERSNCE